MLKTMMKMNKFNPALAIKEWESFVTVCDVTFGAPNQWIIALSTGNDFSLSHILIIAKFMLATACLTEELNIIQPSITNWLKYTPRFSSDPSKVITLNSLWKSRSKGEEVSEEENFLLNKYLQDVQLEASKIIQDCKSFLETVQHTIISNDPLVFHKTCVLLGVDFDEPNVSLTRTLKHTLFGSLLPK